MAACFSRKNWKKKDCFLAIYTADEAMGERCIAIFDNPVNMLAWKIGRQPTKEEINSLGVFLRVVQRWQEGRPFVLHAKRRHTGKPVDYPKTNRFYRWDGLCCYCYIIPNNEEE